jgi:nucleotide-binding universal stress UspA family protein
MKQIKKILYATDLTERSEPAFEQAEMLAKLAGAELHILHVVAEMTDARRGMMQPETFELMEKEVETHALQEMNAFCRNRLKGSNFCTTEVVVGIPFEQIIRRAREIKADLIVVGTHGQTALEHALMGSTAERIVRRSEIPVLTVRDCRPA